MNDNPEKLIDYFGTGMDAGNFNFLSNFYPGHGITLEHKYQAAKTDDSIWKDRILHARTPGEAKKLGRQAPIVSNWEKIKVEEMKVLLAEKFNSDSELATKLLATGTARLVEGNHWGDTFWGVCKGKGQNMLGRLLMSRREELRNG